MIPPEDCTGVVINCNQNPAPRECGGGGVSIKSNPGLLSAENEVSEINDININEIVQIDGKKTIRLFEEPPEWELTTTERLLELGDPKNPPKSLTLIGLLPTHGEFGENTNNEFEWFSAVRYAIRKINSDPDLLPETTLILDLYDTSTEPLIAVTSTLATLEEGLNDPDIIIVGIIGEASSGACEAVSYAASYFNVSMVSFACTTPSLSIKSLHPTFFRSVTSDEAQADAIGFLILELGYENHAAMISTESDYSVGITSAFRETSIRFGINILTSQVLLIDRLQNSTVEELETLKVSRARLFICLIQSTYMRTVLTVADELKLIGPTYVWICSDGCMTSATIRLDNGTASEYLDYLFRGVIGTRPSGGVGNLYKDFLQDEWSQLDKEEYPGAGKMHMHPYAAAAYDATYAWAYTLDNITRTDNRSDHLRFSGGNIRNKLNHTYFQGLTGPFYFTSRFERIPLYEIVNYVGFQENEVPFTEEDEEICLNDDDYDFDEEYDDDDSDDDDCECDIDDPVTNLRKFQYKIFEEKRFPGISRRKRDVLMSSSSQEESSGDEDDIYLYRDDDEIFDEDDLFDDSEIEGIDSIRVVGEYDDVKFLCLRYRYIVWWNGTNIQPDLDVQPPFDYWTCDEGEMETDITGKRVERRSPDGNNPNIISSEYRCDGFIDCKNLSDEKGCNPSLYPAFIIFGIVTGILIICVVLLAIFTIVFGLLPKISHDRVKEAQPIYLFVLLFSSFIGYGSTYCLYGKPHEVSCALFPILAGTSVIFLFSTLCIRAIFEWRKLKSQWNVIKFNFVVFLIGVIILVIPFYLILIVWYIVATPLAGMEEFDDDNAHYVCTSGGLIDGKEPYDIFFGVVAGYCGLVLIVAGVAAFSTRAIRTTYNFSKYIALSVYNLLFLSIIAITVVSVTISQNITSWTLMNIAIIYGFTSTLSLQYVPIIVGMVFDLLCKKKSQDESGKFKPADDE
eukprot:TRINITY_DN1145_c0_g1_i1.p1 TRINITY_DN1145_c0_g1~~TRINITY_DN1145_c0_g1_i1.p1  ORF type:complete len:1120 (-),score=436.42 TRINITY_DN1145_c0_g1_i1:394-3285(-)